MCAEVRFCVAVLNVGKNPSNFLSYLSKEGEKERFLVQTTGNMALPSSEVSIHMEGAG